MIPLPALARLELVRVWREGGLPTALVLFSLLHGLGWALHLGEDRLFGYAYLMGLGVGLRPNLSRDRADGYAALVAISLSRPFQLAGAKLIGVLGFCLGLSLWSGAFSVAVSGGDWAFGAWYGTVFGGVGLLCILPAVAFDLILKVRLPALPAYLLILLGALIVLGAGVPPESLQDWAGLQIESGIYSSLLPALIRGGIGVGGALVVIWWSLIPAGWRHR